MSKVHLIAEAVASSHPLPHLTKVTTELQPGEDPRPWLGIELPHWAVGLDHESGKWFARSPAYELDGLFVESDDPRELVERARMQERLWVAAQAHYTHTVAGEGFVASTVPVPPLEHASVANMRPKVVGELPPGAPVAGTMPIALPSNGGGSYIVNKTPAVGPTQVGPQHPTEYVPPATATTPSTLDLGPPTIEYIPTALEVARLKGYTGNPCGTCGGSSMVQTGSCATCADCGATSGGCS